MDKFSLANSETLIRKALANFFKFSFVGFLLPVFPSYNWIVDFPIPDLLAKSSCVQPFSERKNLIFCAKSIKSP